MKPFLTIGKYSINIQNVAYTERRDDGSIRVYFVGRDDFLLIELPQSEELPRLLLEISEAHAPAQEVPKPEKLQELGSRVEELRRSIEETARTITPPGT